MGQGSLKNEITDKIKNRKDDHIRICLEEDVNAKKVTTGFEDIHLIHRALPEINLEEIDLSTKVFNHEFCAPIIIEGMTGGTERALKINASLAQAVEELGLGMGVGSQRAAIEDPSLEKTFSIARRKAPNAFLIANMGGSQLRRGYGIREAIKAMEMINADALAIHLNPLQECIQPEGETDYKGILEKIKELSDRLDIPVIVKETGAGISSEDAKMLKDAGVDGIDVAGAGGTSWAAVEYYRAKGKGEKSAQMLGELLWDWGIPTVISLIEVVESVDLTVIASGGVRSGLDVAKALSLGADLTGLAHPVLVPALKGSEEVKRMLGYVIEQLRNVMFLVGARKIEDLRNLPVVIIGRTADWLRARGFNPEKFARRGL